MAGFSNVRTPSQEQPKQMSSRLLNMKFMQRAAAATSSATSTPASSTVQTPATEPLAKRRRIDSATSSPVTSTPGTPSNAFAYSGLSTPIASHSAGSGIAPRDGTSTFTRFEGADTEWVLDLKMKFPGDNRVKPPADNDANAKNQGFNASKARFGVLNGWAEEEEEERAEGEDIWNNDQPSGRQTFGSFDRKRKRKAHTRQDQGLDDNDEQDLSPASDSDADDDSESDMSDSSKRSISRQRRYPTKSTTEIDSDEEMHRVRMAIEQKHRSMKGVGNLARTVSGYGSANAFPSGSGLAPNGEKGGKKRKRKQGSSSHQSTNRASRNKKARKTM
ncbi:uncharacterized protein Z519_08454 [Cladophialophora bantiana CBS 173.52]|uniref:Uncharacterized protein n=1 Tax=Cladophialophora bantiana (strain ATCC 10958 / CBS 173.52 / CDC B-1940 / NIH 8579) TaxID=1442370 RepID=A0A0D2EKX0_CLAB1|nr:uncharacterized protein Z519_08454 [Cladophialophora bantiana CBS 173.52]KIW90671.1 hypothetical protein Z519_08454 [Cladophialophora bantiana CBS 173.52]